jgi:integrating conjugative element membrane protein (TIGR03747 family)
MSNTSNANTRAPRPAAQEKKGPSNPLEFALSLVMWGVSSFFIGTLISLAIELVGMYWVWPEQGIHHSRAMVLEDLSYVTEAPRSLLVGDTVGFAKEVLTVVAWPYERLHVGALYVRLHQPEVMARMSRPMASGAGGSGGVFGGIGERLRWVGIYLMQKASAWALVSMYVVQDNVLRLAVVVFALPAFLLACLLGVIDGLVQRDLRRWGGGREYGKRHLYAKHWSKWSLTLGFGLHLSWPVGGFNPSYMVLIFTALTAVSLSVQFANYQKYV